MKRTASLRRKQSLTVPTTAVATATNKRTKRAAPAPTKRSARSLPTGLHVSALVGSRPYMEDTYSFHFGKDSLVFGVFDGHGGDICSKYCASNVCQALAEHEMLYGSPQKAFLDVFQRLDRAFCEKDGESGAGSTATVGVLQQCGEPNKLKFNLGYVGDSSAMLVRGEDGTYEMLTSNHNGSRDDERVRIEKLGGVVTFDEEDSIYRVGGVLAVTRAIGDSYLKPYVCSMPEVTEVKVGQKDIVVIASDGLWDEVEPLDIVRSIREHGVDAAIKRLVKTAAKYGDDNVCAAALDIGKVVDRYFSGCTKENGE